MAESNAPLTFDQALTSAEKRAQNKARTTARTKALIVEGAKGFHGYLFPYAPSVKYPESHFALVPCQTYTLQQLGLNLATKDNVFYKNKAGKIRKHRQVVIGSMRYSFITRKAKTSVKKGVKGTPSSAGYKREWHTCPIPKNAREVDILKFISTWSKQPEVIEINGGTVLMKVPKSAIFQGLKPKSGKAASTKAPVAKT